MEECVKCGNPDASYEYYEEGYVCDKCAEDMFTCPDCGRVFEWDDTKNSNAGGFCAECVLNH